MFDTDLLRNRSNTLGGQGYLSSDLGNCQCAELQSINIPKLVYYWSCAGNPLKTFQYSIDSASIALDMDDSARWVIIILGICFWTSLLIFEIQLLLNTLLVSIVLNRTLQLKLQCVEPMTASNVQIDSKKKHAYRLTSLAKYFCFIFSFEVH